MNFKLTKEKLIGSIAISFVIALINYSRVLFGGLNLPINYLNVILIWPISTIIIYIIWSLFEKK